MNGRELENRQAYYRYRKRVLRRLITASALVVLIVMLGVLAIFKKLPSITLSPSPPKDIPPEALFVNSGLRRAMLTRTKVINYDFQPTQTSDNTSVGGTNVVTAMLEGDLGDPKTGNQFPSSLVQLNASPISRGRLQLSTVINPTQLPSPSGGTYHGTVDVFAGTQVLHVPLVLYLAPRDGALASIAILLLVIGATIGLAVKWITESLTRLAAARWRVEDLNRSIGGDRNSLPLMAAAQLEEIEDQIRRQDTDDHLDKTFAPLLSNVHNLRSFAIAVRTAEDEIERQRHALGYGFDGDDNSIVDQDFVESIARAESTRIERLRALEWPWNDPVAAINDAQKLADQCSTATLALSDATASRISTTTFQVLDLFRKGNFDEAVDLYRKPQEAAGEVQAPKPKKPRIGRFDRISYYQPILSQLLGGSEGGLVAWMARRPRWFAGAASVLVVSLVGLQLQYLNADNFGGELGDWLGLLLWATVVELSGVSVLDVLSRLGAPAAPRGGATPPTTPITSRDSAR
jgi:hypothetical protein